MKLHNTQKLQSKQNTLRFGSQITRSQNLKIYPKQKILETMFTLNLV